MSTPNLWDPSFIPAAIDTDLVSGLEKAISGAEKTATAAVTTAVTGVEQAAGQVVGSVVAPSPSLPAAVNSATAAVSTSIEQAAIQAAKNAAAAALPDIQKALEGRLATVAQSELQAVLTKLNGESPATPDLADFTKADARSRAFRTLIGGVILSALWGLTNVLGNLATVNWTNKDALPQVVAIATSAVLGSVWAYVQRVISPPAHLANVVVTPLGGSTSS